MKTRIITLLAFAVLTNCGGKEKPQQRSEYCAYFQRGEASYNEALRIKMQYDAGYHWKMGSFLENAAEAFALASLCENEEKRERAEQRLTSVVLAVTGACECRARVRWVLWEVERNHPRFSSEQYEWYLKEKEKAP